MHVVVARQEYGGSALCEMSKTMIGFWRTAKSDCLLMHLASTGFDTLHVEPSKTDLLAVSFTDMCRLCQLKLTA